MAKILETIKCNKKILILPVAVCIIALGIVNGMNKGIELDNSIQEQVSQFNGGLKDGELYIEPVNIKTDMGKYDSHIKLDVNRDNLQTIDNYDGFTYVTYKGEDGKELKEILISDEIPEKLNMKGLEHKWYSRGTTVGTEGASIRGVKTLGSGYLYVSSTAEKLKTTKEFKESINEIANKIQFSEHSDIKDVIINIDGLGRLQLSQLSVFEKDNGIYYGKDKILRLYNPGEDTAYIWITHINNTLMMNTVANLEETEYNNVYVDKDYKDPERMCYKTYSIMTSAGMYTVKFNEKAPEGLEDEFLTMLGIHKDDTKIELPFKLNEEN